jgi:hypothetical protein
VKYFAILALLFCVAAPAAEKLPLTCPTYPDCGNSQRVFDVPGPDTMVSTKAGWVRFADADEVLVCLDDLEPGAHTGECPRDRKVRVPRCEVAGAECNPGPNTITVVWQPPTENDDGSALKDLAGYKIYSGVAHADGSAPTADELTLLRTLADPDADSITLPGYGWGKFYFAVTAYNSKLRESDRSNLAVADLPEPVKKPGQVQGVTVEVTVVTGP